MPDPKVTIWEDVNFGGRCHTYTASTGDLTGWEHRSASSLKVEGFNDFDCVQFLETVDNESDDLLYLQGNGELANLHTLLRPHGTNNWGDRISQIRFFKCANAAFDNNTILNHGSRSYWDGHQMRQLAARV